MKSESVQEHYCNDEDQFRMTIDEVVTACGFARNRPLEEAEVVSFEGLIGSPLPADYRELLFRCEGLMPDARYVTSGSYPDRIFGLCDDEDFSLRAAMEKHGGDLPPGWIAIADEHSANLICMELSGEARGSVWRFDCEMKSERRLADSFEAFVGALEVADHRSPSTIQYDDARIDFDAGRFTQARERFEQSWELEANGATAFWLAQTLTRLGFAGESRIWLARAYELKPLNSMIATGHALARIFHQ